MCCDFKKCSDPAEKHSDDHSPAVLSDGCDAVCNGPGESELGLMTSPADSYHRSSVLWVQPAELFQRQKQAGENLQQLAGTSAMKWKLDMCTSVNNGADGPAEMESRFCYQCGSDKRFVLAS